MSLKVRVVLAAGLLLVAAAAVFLIVLNPLRASPGHQEGIDLERFADLKARVERLRLQGHDVSRLDATIASIEQWISQGDVFAASLSIGDLQSDLDYFEAHGFPVYPTAEALPPAPRYPAIPEAGERVLFQDDFSSGGALSAWQEHAYPRDPGNMAFWELDQQALHLNLGAGSLSTIAMVQVAGQSYDNFVYSVDIYPQDNQEVGAVFRYQNDSYYRFRFLSGEHSGVPTRLLERVDGGQAVVLAAAEGRGFQPGQWYNVQIVARGSQIAVYLDGQPILQATDSQLARGQVGVFGLSLGNAYFDNVRVTEAR